MENDSWQRSSAALYFWTILSILFTAWCWWMSWPLAVAGHAGAVQNLLTSFGMAAMAVSLLAVFFKRPRLIVVGASCWSLAFYLSSLFVADLVQGPNVGVAIRVGALSNLFFALSAAFLLRKVNPQVREEGA